MGKLLRHREDAPAVLIVLGILSIQLWAVLTLDSIPALFAVMGGLLLFSACPGSINHNHHHVTTFRQPWLNRIYEVILFLETGVPPFAWTIHHNLGHHKHYLEPDQDPAAWLDRDGSVMSRVKFDLYNAARVYPEIIRIGKQRPMLLARFYRWVAVSLAVLAVLLWLNPVASLIIFVLPMPVMLVFLLDNTYSQHQGLDMSSDMTASRNTTSKLYNLMSWNLGYHTAHHLRPNLHWSQLPELHRKLEQDIPANLVGDSIFLSACDGGEGVGHKAYKASTSGKQGEPAFATSTRPN